MRLSVFILAAFLMLQSKAASIGTWKAYMAYSDITEVEKGGNIYYVLASDGLFTYNTNDGSIRTYDKSNFLSECVISHIAWCQSAKKLFIAYENGVFDLMDASDNVETLADLYNKTMTEDKTINSLYVSGRYVYVCTGFGIIKVDVTNAEISNTYNLGKSISFCVIDGSYIYASAADGTVYEASLSDNLTDKNVWSTTETSITQTTNTALVDSVKNLNLNPGGPKYNHFAELKYYNGKLYTVGGYFLTGVSDAQYTGMVQVLSDDDWTIYQEDVSATTGYDYKDMMSIAIDPTNNSHVFAGGRTGLYEFSSGQLKAYYNADNSPLKGARDGSSDLGNNYVLVLGLQYDNSGNLWVLNSQTYGGGGLLEYSDGTWTNHTKSSMKNSSGVTYYNMRDLLVDEDNNIWFVASSWRNPSLMYYNVARDSLIVYSSFVNQNGTTVSVTDVNCVTQDKNGNIWIGTDVGPLMLSSSKIGTSDKVFTQVLVNRNDGSGYADYLLSGINISDIAVDAANRKWFVSTTSGAYLISSDNQTEVQHFLSDETPLLSDNILAVDINHTSGEVFFATENGLCSYVSDATSTNSEMTTDNVWAYPNPVTPDYTGLITIVGLSYNADVKILSSSGALVAEGKSSGGTFTWDGKDKSGKKVASGVYMVNTATQDGNKGTVCKIGIVR